MDELAIWDALKSVINWVVVPLVGGVIYFMKRQVTRLDKVEEDLQQQKIRTSVVESKVDDIRNDIKDIKRNVERLVERN